MFDIPKVAMANDVRCKAYKEHYAVLFLLCLSWTLSQKVTLTKSCAHFTFENPTVRTNSVYVTENTAVVLLFYLKNVSCSNLENTTITIRRLDITTNKYTPQCDIVLKYGTCRNTTQEHIYCGCTNTFGEYTFSKIVSKSDITWWKWTTKDGLADDVYIWFNESLWYYTSVSSTHDQIVSSLPATPEENTFSKVMLYVIVTVAVGAGLIIIIISLLIAKYVKKGGQEKQTQCVEYEGSDFDDERFSWYDGEPEGNGPAQTDLALKDFMETYYNNV